MPGSCPELFGQSIIIFITNLGLCIILMHLGHIPGYWAETNLFFVQTSVFFVLVKYFTEQVIQVSIFVRVLSNIIFLKYLELFTLSIYAGVVSWALEPVHYYFLHQPWSMHYTYVPWLYPELLGWSKFIFLTNCCALCLSEILHRTSHSCQHICLGSVQYYFFEVPPTVHIVYICQGCYPELLGWSMIIFFTNLRLYIILMCLHHILSISAGPTLFSLPTSVYALYLCTRVVS